MFMNEKLQPNVVNAPTLFIGVGGIGSKITKGIHDRAINDDTSNIRFVVMDTDVNDLLSVGSGSEIIAIQTSSTSTVENYLKNDKDAKQNWFPENKMLDQKTVSEGAGQIRGISRLAINDIIKNSKIHALYKAIDDLFLKDGGGLKQAIRVVISSTAAGGTGSGIAMIMGMLVRHYVKKNYPEAAVMIRGFLVMPGVMDTVITTQSERDSQRCNGYATIKEINAFMMKGSGFFDTVPELQRYRDLQVTIPSASAGEESLSNLPFDFCFLMDRTDSNAGNMTTLPQYIDYAAQSLYEQNIGPMNKKASSMEDNVLKLCIDPDRLGRCRFGGTGASVLTYPYKDIRDYIALNWARSAIIGSSSNDKLTDEERKAILESSWLQYDENFKQEYKDWEENPNASSKNEPTLAGVYMSKIESGADAGSGNDFTMMLWDKYLTPKVKSLGDDAENNIDFVASKYIDALIDGVIDGQLEREFAFRATSTFSQAKNPAEQQGYSDRYLAINSIENAAKNPRLNEVVKSFAKEVFNSKVSANKEDLGEYMLTKFLSVNGRLMHPNAVRYLLYKLAVAIEVKSGEVSGIINTFESKKLSVTEGITDNDDGRDSDKFSVALYLGKEANLDAMCEACDKLKSLDNVAGNPGSRCNDILEQYNNLVIKFFKAVIANEICNTARSSVNNLIKSYEEFYKTFQNKIPSIEKLKDDIVSKLTFRNGDCVCYLLGKRDYLDKITEIVGRPIDNTTEASKLYAKIFESLRNNAYIEARRNVNPFNYEKKKDIFDDIIIEYYKDRVEDSCDVINVESVLHGIKLEYDVKSAMELDNIDPSRKDRRAQEIGNPASFDKYMNEVIEKCRNLASPNVKKKDNEEPREVDAVACSIYFEDCKGFRVDKILYNPQMSPTVSRYELHFFRSVYNIMPTQLSKLSAPTYDENTDEFSVSSKNEYEKLSAGDYFSIYQRYMDRIGPDSKTSAIITPHIDKRWNAISVMPEMDMEYQKRLMRKIHKSMLYGFVYGRIKLYKTSDENPDEKVYKYLDCDNDNKTLVVSNNTKCDILYEVLDALYFDRMAVATIRSYVNDLRVKNAKEGFRSYEDLEFFKKLKTLKFRKFFNKPELNNVDDRVSLFTVVLLYCNSLPVKNKDTAEMKTMVEAIIEMIYSEMNICAQDDGNLLCKVSDILVDQFNCLMDNFKKYSDVLNNGIFAEQVVDSIYRTICKFFTRRDLEKYVSKLEAPEED